MSATLERVHPVLMSSDVARSLGYYERLGFRETFRDDPAEPRYAAVERDGVELHLQWHGPEQWAHAGDRPTYRFPVRDVDALFAEFRQSGVVPEASARFGPWATPADTPWGTREFHLRDPDRNGLQFYRTLQPGA